jgi:signal transduction histidine kinase
MIDQIRSKFEDQPYLVDLFYTMLFGILSLVFATLKFYIPGFEGGTSDLREIPLLISIFYIRNPIYILGLSLFTSIISPEDGSFLATFLMHFISLLVAWVYYYKVNNGIKSNLIRGLGWMMFTAIYYFVFIVPILIIVNKMDGVPNNLNFLDSYKTVISSLRFEFVATSLVTGLYLMQIGIRKTLIEHKQNLESKVNIRTAELAAANGRLSDMNLELISNSDQIKSMNENLDSLVKERSKKIEDQLNLLIRYAHMNSHEVRAPLARILGLLEIIKLEKSVKSDSKVVTDLCLSGKELDDVVISMNRLLEKEIQTDENS